MEATLHRDLQAFFGERGMMGDDPSANQTTVVQSGDAGKSAG
jgi:hypothetical protein